MGPQAAVNAVYYNKIQEIPAGPERDAYVAKLRDEYRADIDLMKLASELVDRRRRPRRPAARRAGVAARRASARASRRAAPVPARSTSSPRSSARLW